MINIQSFNNIAVITMYSPPVNALGLELRTSLLKALQQSYENDAVDAVIIESSLPLFCAGADIEELRTGDIWQTPDLHALIDAIDNAPKLVIAAINGIAMGGGLELTMACDYRIARQAAKLGLPEIKLGLFPGAGGTQRLPRLAGLQVATDMILSGNPITAAKAESVGLVDRVVSDDVNFRQAAVAYCEELLNNKVQRRHCSDIQVDPDEVSDDFFIKIRVEIANNTVGQIAPEHCLTLIESTTLLPFAEGLEQEKKDFIEILKTPQARAMTHLFFAERESQKIPGVERETATREINSVALIGAGTMGTGITIACLDAGLPVTLIETTTEALDRGLGNISKHYDRSVEKGRINEEQAESLKAAVTGTLDFAGLADTDLVIEAVFEELEIKQMVFEQLDKHCKPGAILASNTSTLDLDVIAAITSRPEDVIGLHFFSPANIMRLLEIVRGQATAAEVLKTALQFGKRIRKLPVVVGVCFGFVGNRMFEPYFREGSRLLLEGASPEQVDRVLTEFGMAMGIVSVADLAGIDVSYRIRESRRQQISHDPSYQAIQDKLFELGRYGQKSGRGSYFYEGREKTSDPEVVKLCEALASGLNIKRRDISDQEILERCLYPLINEGIQILDEGIAYRPGDCDLIWVNGYGFPAWRGGPLHYADEIGLKTVLAGMSKYAQQLGDYGKLWFKPAKLLETLVRGGIKLSDYVPSR
ncbi:MAG: 3-hydroxyacyl-CoA dehydrogenase NAD-binding domain-containing protein [Gammaproteobacteria bacterium]|nr:3-hydroxyacyl-CoA dehydrogenase NAD-binding domain-containing protein [Gammaproteobacteria bacterium]